MSPTKRLTALSLVLLLWGGCNLGTPTGGGTGVDGLTGTLVSADGSPVAGAWVKVYPANDSTTALAKGAAGQVLTVAIDSVQTGANGSFQIPGLASGSYNIVATAVKTDTTLSYFLQGVVFTKRLDLGTDTLKISGSVTIEVQSMGLPVADAVCFIPGSPFAGRTNEQGTCTVTGLPPGRFEIVLTHSGYQLGVMGDLQVLSGILTNGGLLNLIGLGSAPSSAPTLLSPSSITTVTPLSGVLKWRSVSSAAAYHVQLATDSNFSAIVLQDSLVIDTTKAYGPLANGTYYWRVRARNTVGFGPWSARFKFVTVAAIVPLAKTMLVATGDVTLSSSVPGQPDVSGYNDKNRGVESTTGPGTFNMNATSRSLIRFSLPKSVAPSQITSAVIRLTTSAWSKKNVSAPFRVDMHRMLKSWKEGTGTQTKNSAIVDGATATERFWGNQDGSEDWTQVLVGLNDIDASSVPVFSVSKSYGDATVWEFDVTELAKVWAGDSTLNFGILLASDFPASNSLLADYAEFHTREASVADSLKPVLILNGPPIENHTPVPPPVPGALAAYWNFEEASGGAALDQSGNGANGIPTGAGTRVSGVLGKAVTFDGTTHFEVPDSLINLNGDFTLSAWVWQSSQNDDQPIFDFCCTNTYTGLHLWVNTNGLSTIKPGSVFANLRPGPPTSVQFWTPNGVLPGNRWNHIALTYDATKRQGRLYANGAPYDSVTLSAGQVPGTLGSLFIGYRTSISADSERGSHFIGKLDEVRIYKRALTAAQLDSVYRSLPVTDTTLIASQDADIVGSAPFRAEYIENATQTTGRRSAMPIGVYDLNTVGRGLIQFQIPPTVTGAKIAKAVLRISTIDWVDKNAHPDSVRLYAHRLLRSWKEGTSSIYDGATASAAMDGVTALERFYGNQDGSEDWNAKLVGLDDVDASSVAAATATRPNKFIGHWDFDITALAKSWADNSAQNFGVIVLSDIPSDDGLVVDLPWFHSKDSAQPDSLKPSLILTYQ